MSKYKSIDLFAGIGGIRMGFDRAFGDDIETSFVCEWDEYAQKTYKANFHDDFDIAGDITQIDEKDVPSFDICLAGFPCQAFSLAGQRKGFEDDYKGRCRGTLFLDVARICEYHKPKVIFCENVKGLVIHDHGRTFKIITKTFEDLGYKVFFKVLNSRNFGVPQNRERIYVVAFRNDIAPEKFEFPDVVDDTKRLIDIREENPVPAKYYLSDVYVETLKRHKARHAAKGNGFGYEIRDWNDVAGAIVCGGMGRERNLVIDNRQTDLTPTTHIRGSINTQGIRKMTPREWARLQGFPDNFKFVLADVHLYKQFGNSVTVNVIQAIAERIKKVLDGTEEDKMPMKYNKGEWSELYAFIKLLKEGRVYAADKDANRIDDQYLPIIRLIREEVAGSKLDYFPGEKIRLYKNGAELAELDPAGLEEPIATLFGKILGAAGEGAFEIPEIKPLMNNLHMTKVKANSTEKADIEMQIHDRNTGFEPEVGFSIKSDVGSAPTLLNPGKNTLFRYKIEGLSDEDMQAVNAIDKSKTREYMKERFTTLWRLAKNITYDSMRDETYEDNLTLIDSWLPRIMGEVILKHYIHISEGIYDCVDLLNFVADANPLGYRRPDLYAIKFKKLLTASALGMTPGKVWDGKDSATGGYIIIKRDGDVLCYHLYNRNFFEDYLLNNTRIDRPSASRYDFGYVYEKDGNKYIDLNVQVRFKPIGTVKEDEENN